MKERLINLLTHFGYTATRFADEIGVQRSGISHILSGRNYPSYDFILRITKRFPEISLDWLILGEGGMMREYKKESDSDKVSLSADKVTNVTSIVQIAIFYADGSFRIYYPGTKE
jgi:transcriptional regulator with XRE-family HTH domain